jgi:chromosome segregation ATPase
LYEKKIDAYGKKGDRLTKEQVEFRAANTALKSNLSTASNNYETLQAEHAKLAHEKKDLMIQLENVKKDAKSLWDEKNALKLTRNQLVDEK